MKTAFVCFGAGIALYILAGLAEVESFKGTAFYISSHIYIACGFICVAIANLSKKETK